MSSDTTSVTPSIFRKHATLEDIRAAVLVAYGNATGATTSKWRKSTGGPLTPDVANPSALMLRAVEIAGDDGLTLQQLRAVFSMLGKERFDAGLTELRSLADAQAERRPNKAGRLQAQTVFRRQRP